MPNSCFINEYGPTETVVGTSTFTINTVEELAALSEQINVPIGHPIGYAQLYVVGASGQLQPANSIGELYIGGPGVSQGYVNLGGPTAEQFISFAGQRVYKTGDLVRWCLDSQLDGQLEFIGRADEQVKINGYRIELGEIKQQLQSMAQVKQAEVLAVESGQSTRLVAYLVGEADAELEQACRLYLQQQLPEYMQPSAYVSLDSLPLTINGKLDRSALPVAAGEPSSVTDYVAPTTRLERLLVEVWTQVLSQEQVGIHDNFFSLGGDSILSIRVVSLLKRENVFVSIKDLFTHQTIAQLSTYIDDTQDPQVIAEQTLAFGLLTDDERATILEGNDDGTVEDAYPLSSLQAGMVFHTQLADFSGVYHDINADHIVCPWDQPLFAQALTDCITAHPILRSRYRLSGDRALQLVYREVALPLVVEDIRQMDEDAQQHYVQTWQQNHQRHQFDWAQGPLFQVNIFRRTDESFAFAISFHHSILDGWSRASLSTTLYNRYQQLLAGEQPEPLVDETIYREYIALEQRALQSDTARAYFVDMLADAPPQQLPVMTNLSDDEAGYGLQQVTAFSERSAGLIALAASLGVPVQTV
ncbi:MAG: AMP-binding protein, partial [Algicola sp.]|nr:AMP-binding protein [Algicola sp.]